MIKKCVIPAAGYGTRFLPITKSLPKEMLPIIDRPAIELIVEEAISSGISEIFIIISDNKKAILDYFGRNLELEQFLKEKNQIEMLSLIEPKPNVKIHYIKQDEQLGLGHAISCAETFIGDEPFAVLLGDDVYVNDDLPAIKQLIDLFKTYNSHILGTMEVADSEVSSYGICEKVNDNIGPVFELKNVVEKPSLENAPSRSAISGRYIFKPSIFKYLKEISKGSNNEIQLTDAIVMSMKAEKVYSYDIIGTRYDIGSKFGYLKAIIDFSLNRTDLKADLLKYLKEKIVLY
ncbi:MAG: UTP--glucose-1-phosphate uridylyltransferase [Acholeplasmataceae bacterium]|nr:UTP--glucose-1-phosphate uridylyltransferase [Acholeplasmataceae bacterium]